MRVKMILPALSEALGPFWRAIKYSLFPPLGLATLAGHLSPDDEVEIIDEHVERVALNDRPDLVVLQVYITSANRAYKIADHYRQRGVRVVMGGLHVTALPHEAAAHADTIFIGPGEDSWPRFLEDLRNGTPQPRYVSVKRTLRDIPSVRRDLIKRQKYLVPNSLVVSRGCPHRCDFCYKEAFYEGGKSFYTVSVEQALAEIDGMPGKHLYFLDDNLFGSPLFARQLFDAMAGMGRIWQGAGTVQVVLERPDLLDAAVKSGLRSLFVGFETLNTGNLEAHGKLQNLHGDYTRAIQMLHDRGVMVNASFVFGMDGDGPEVFERTVDWAVSHGLETATFHILTPYPGTRLYKRFLADGRINSFDWERYDTRHAVYVPHGMTVQELEAGYWRAYDQFYAWGNLINAANTKADLAGRMRHLAYVGGWKKLEPMWNAMVKSESLGRMRPLLEHVLDSHEAQWVNQAVKMKTRALWRHLPNQLQ